MAFTAKLGTSDSTPGNIEPGLGSDLNPSTVGRDSGVAFRPSINATGGYEPPRYQRIQTLSSTGTSASFSVTPTPGHFIALIGRVSAVSDNQGNTWHVATNAATPLEIFYAYNIASSGTFTITVTAAGNGQWVATEWSGFGTIDPLQGAASAYDSTLGTPPFTITSSNSTPPERYGVTIAGVSCDNVGFCNGITPSYSPPWTIDVNFGGFGVFGASREFKATDTQTATFTFTGSTNFQKAIAYFANRQEVVGNAVGTSTVTAGGFPIFEGGHILLETGDSILLEDGSFALLESTTDGSAGTASGNATVTAVSATISTGSGGITISAPTLNGTSGTFTNPNLADTQAPVEDLEESSSQQLFEDQLAVEDIEYFDFPILSIDQEAVEDLEIYDLPIVSVTQMVVEILIPFDCDLTPPLTLPPGCPPDEIEGEGSSSTGCADTPATGSGTSKAGCKPTFRN